MGNEFSMDENEYSGLSGSTYFTEEKIKSLHEKFNKLDKSGKGYITTEDLESFCGIESSDLNTLIFKSFSSGDGKVEFTHFLELLSIFYKGTEEERNECNIDPDP